MPALTRNYLSFVLAYLVKKCGSFQKIVDGKVLKRKFFSKRLLTNIKALLLYQATFGKFKYSFGGGGISVRRVYSEEKLCYFSLNFELL